VAKTTMNRKREYNHPHPRHARSRKVENILILQGGGSLGAFACGVFKALSKYGIRFDIVAGTSIGAINAALIIGSKGTSPEKDLEEFWVELSESTYNFIPDWYLPSFDHEKGTMQYRRIPSAALNAAFFGVPKMFKPRLWHLSSSGENIWWQWPWATGESPSNTPEIMPINWTYMYDHSPLAKTLEKYVDFNKLAPEHVNKGGSRLVITCVNVLTAEPIVFDSGKMNINAKHLLASSAYPNYGFPWVEIQDGVFGWDGALMSNTPLREVMDISPRNDKHVYIVENYPRVRNRLPQNKIEVADRARDITFSDKTTYDIETSHKMTRMIELVEHIYDMFEKNISAPNHSKLDEDEMAHIKNDYMELVERHGAEILSVNRITRNELESPYLLKNADFSPATIKELILQGEQNVDSLMLNSASISNNQRQE
jgi:NTE family protein